MTGQESILLGVVSGVLTAVLIFLIKEAWENYITPWYRNFRYQGADISGSWFADKDSDIKSTFSVVLKQNAHKVTGSMQFSHISTSRTFNIDYNLTGEYWKVI